MIQSGKKISLFINKCLSMFYDCIAQANEMNGYFLDKDNLIFINSIRKKKRFGKW